jgi:hypothetical protein
MSTPKGNTINESLESLEVDKVTLSEKYVGGIHHIHAVMGTENTSSGVLKYAVKGYKGLIGKITVHPTIQRTGIGRRMVARMVSSHPEVVHWRISGISGKRAALFWFRMAAELNVTIYSDQYGEISLERSRSAWMQWSNEAWQYWLLPASLNEVRTDPVYEKDHFAGDEDYPFDAELYASLVGGSYNAHVKCATIRSLNEVDGYNVIAPQADDPCMDNTLQMARDSMSDPPIFDPRHGYHRGVVEDGVHRLSACREIGSNAVVRSLATREIDLFLRCEDPASVYYSTPVKALVVLADLEHWWKTQAPAELLSLNTYYVARLEEARGQMVAKYGL